MLSLSDAINRKLLFIQGKGGVGKTLFSKALAEIRTEQLGLSSGKSVLLVQIDDPREPRHDIVKNPAGYFTLNATVRESSLEYAGLKLKSQKLARLLLDHKVINYLVEAAPGIKELSLIGKIWYETRNFSTVIVDMPSTGHALTLFQAFRNWADLFENSPIAKDSAEIEQDISNPEFAAHLLMALPEEMPLTESAEMKGELEKLFKNFSSRLVVNKITEKDRPGLSKSMPNALEASGNALPYSRTATEYFSRRRELEAFHLKTVEKENPVRISNFLPGSDLISQFKAEIRADLLAHDKLRASATP